MLLLLFNTKIPETIALKKGLTFMYGLGPTKITYLLKKMGFSNTLKVLTLTHYKTIKLQRLLTNSKFQFNINLKKYQQQYIKKLSEIKHLKYIKKKSRLNKVKNKK